MGGTGQGQSETVQGGETVIERGSQLAIDRILNTGVQEQISNTPAPEQFTRRSQPMPAFKLPQNWRERKSGGIPQAGGPEMARPVAQPTGEKPVPIPFEDFKRAYFQENAPVLLKPRGFLTPQEEEELYSIEARWYEKARKTYDAIYGQGEATKASIRAIPGKFFEPAKKGLEPSQGWSEVTPAEWALGALDVGLAFAPGAKPAFQAGKAIGKGAIQAAKPAIREAIVSEVGGIGKKAAQKAVPPIAPLTEAPKQLEVPLKSTVDNFITAVERMKKAQPATKILMSAERGKRFQEAETIMRSELGGYETIRKMGGPLKGELPRSIAETPQEIFTRDHFTQLENAIIEAGRQGKIKPIQVKDAGEALAEYYLNGKIPQPHQLNLFENVFGKEFAGAIQATSKSRGMLWNVLDALNAPRAVLSSWDVSAPFLQGLVLTTRHPVTASKSMKAMFKALVKEKNALALDEVIRARPNTQIGIDAGLYIAPITEKQALTAMEESFMSRFARKFPGVRQSERAYISYLNDLRSRAWERGIKALETMGRTSDADLKSLAEFVNWATGRGTVPKSLSGMTPLLNATLFSPRKILANLQLPSKLVDSNPYVRKEAWKSLGTVLGFGSTMLGIVYLRGGDVELDPRSADFGKVKIGNIRLDMWGGYSQYVRFAAQLATAQRKTAGGNIRDINRLETIERFAQSKTSPAFGLFLDIMRGESYMGEEMALDTDSLTQQAFNRFVPLFPQDMKDAIEQEGLLGGLAVAPAVFGVGATVYTDPTAKVQKQIAEREYGMNWEDVGKKYGRAEQIRLEQSSPELQAAKEKEDAKYAKSITGKSDVNARWGRESKLVEKRYQETIDVASKEFKTKGDGKTFREKVEDAALVRRAQYDTLNKNPDYAEVAESLQKPLDEDDLKRMNENDVARRRYNELLYSDDMYDEFGNYRFDQIDIRRKEFVSQYGMDALNYVEDYQGIKESTLNPLYKELKRDKKLMQPYWDETLEMESAQKNAWRRDNPEVDAALNLWGYVTTVQSLEAREILERRVKELGLDSEMFPALTKPTGGKVTSSRKSTGKTRSGKFKVPEAITSKRSK